MGTTLGPKYIPCSYMEPLGKSRGTTGHHENLYSCYAHSPSGK